MRMVRAAALLFLFCAPLNAWADVSDCVPGEVIVMFRSAGSRGAASTGGVSDAFRTASAAAESGARVVTTYDALSENSGGVFALLKSDVLSAEELAERLAARDDVEAVIPNHIRRVSFTPDDPGLPAMWGIDAANIRSAWDITTGSEEVYVAVLDTGVDYTHPDIAGNFDFALSRNFYSMNADDFADENGHGTHVAGIIGAVGNNARAVAGVSWHSKLISLRTLGRNGIGPVSLSISAINYLVKILNENPSLKIAAVNISSAFYSSMTPTPENQRKDAYYRALKTLSDMDRTLIIVAAGNEGIEVGVPAPADDPKGVYKKGEYVYEGSYTGLDNMIVVAAFDASMNMPSYSNRSSSRVHIAAPGSRILSTLISAHSKSERLPDGSIVGLMTGTSMATPHVSGAAALVQSLHPDRRASQVRDALLGGANGNYFENETIYGALDVRRALEYAAEPLPTDTPSMSPRPSDDAPSADPLPSGDAPSGPSDDDSPFEQAGNHVEPPKEVRFNIDGSGVQLSFSVLGVTVSGSDGTAVMIEAASGRSVKVKEIDVLITGPLTGQKKRLLFKNIVTSSVRGAAAGGFAALIQNDEGISVQVDPGNLYEGKNEVSFGGVKDDGQELRSKPFTITGVKSSDRDDDRSGKSSGGCSALSGSAAMAAIACLLFVRGRRQAEI